MELDINQKSRHKGGRGALTIAGRGVEGRWQGMCRSEDLRKGTVREDRVQKHA